jgi:hypothetical protein
MAINVSNQGRYCDELICNTAPVFTDSKEEDKEKLQAG